jgi:hypothetical protein
VICYVKNPSDAGHQSYGLKQILHLMACDSP